MKLLTMRLRTLLLLMVPIALLCGFMVALRSAKMASRQSVCQSHLEYIYGSLLRHRLGRGHYPPAVYPDRFAVNQHSWRAVASIQSSGDFSYSNYNLFQPWNSPANIKTAAEAHLDFFRCPNNQAVGVMDTNYVAVIVNGVSTLELADAIPNGAPEAARQVLLIEYQNSGIGWTEPRDLDIKDLAKLGPGADPDGIGVLFADGSFRRFRVEELPALFRH